MLISGLKLDGLSVEMRAAVGRAVVEAYVWGFSRGDEKLAKAVMEGIWVERHGGRGGVRAVAKKHGVGERSLQRWVRRVRAGTQNSKWQMGK